MTKGKKAIEVAIWITLEQKKWCSLLSDGLILQITIWSHYYELFLWRQINDRQAEFNLILYGFMTLVIRHHIHNTHRAHIDIRLSWDCIWTQYRDTAPGSFLDHIKVHFEVWYWDDNFTPRPRPEYQARSRLIKWGNIAVKIARNVRTWYFSTSKCTAEWQRF